MRILTAVRDLSLLKNILHQELPQSISVYGGLLHILQNNACHLRVCVDSWPTFTTAICYRNIQASGANGGDADWDVIPDICTVFTKDPGALRGLLVHPEVINWRDGLMFRGIPSSRCDLIKELASQKGLQITEFNGFKTIFHHSPEDMASCHGDGADCIQYIESLRSQTPLTTRKRQLSISTLEDSHAELVDSFLPYGGYIRTITYVRAAIRHLPNTSIKDEHGCPVSWQLTNELGELTMSYTLPEHRRLGYTIALTRTAVLKLHSMGFPIYCNVHHKNQAAMNCLISLGFSLCPEMQTMSALLICRDRK